MDLVTRGRLSVQRVEEGAWLAINQLAEKGGWEELDLKPSKKGKEKKSGVDAAPAKSRKPAKRKSKKEASEDEDQDAESEPEAHPAESTSGASASTKRRKETARKEPTGDRQGTRRSARTKR